MLPAADVTVTNCFWLPALLRITRRIRAGIGALNVHAQRFPKWQYRLYRGADRISTVSEVIASAIRQQAPGLASIIKIIPNPVDVEVFRPDGPSNRDAARRTILFTGRVHPEKGLELLVSAARRVHAIDSSVRLVLVGPTAIERGGGGVRFVDRLKSLAESLPLEFMGNIADPRELATTLRSCDVYCYPSMAFLGEASPVAPLEAMACGALVIVSDLPQFNGYVKDGVTGLVFPRNAPDNVERLAAFIRAGLTDEARSNAIRAAGVAQAQALSAERIADAYLADFEELVKARANA
jgi:glycosyltransferase involved in cell wall biosynthesis